LTQRLRTTAVHIWRPIWYNCKLNRKPHR